MKHFNHFELLCRTGPDVHGTRPVLVTFETFKDRETVLKLAKTLSKKAKINVSEDLSKRTREARFVLCKINVKTFNFQYQFTYYSYEANRLCCLLGKSFVDSCAK